MKPTMSPMENLEAQWKESEEVRKEFFARSKEDLLKVSSVLGECIKSGGKILVCGNGGSAADSLHFAGEMIGRMMKERRAVPAIAIPSDVAMLTAVGNDYGYSETFARSVDGLGREGDLLFAISTSGNSPNVLRAVEVAREKKMKVVALTGGSGGKLGSVADYHLNVALGKNSPRIQETHIQVIHLLVDLMDQYYLDGY
ncbi:MAG: SIS domain-containing protein [Oligoflexia bacterium]|nr:SIS domain-containing protein [Oligoflexia bacterium]